MGHFFQLCLLSSFLSNDIYCIDSINLPTIVFAFFLLHRTNFFSNSINLETDLREFLFYSSDITTSRKIINTKTVILEKYKIKEKVIYIYYQL